MVMQIQQRRGTTAEHAVFVGADAEITVDTDKNALVVHDGTTAGGHETAKASDLSAKANQTDLDTANAAIALKANQADLNTTNTNVALKANQADLDTTNTALALKADEAYVDSAVAGVVDSAPAVLDTLSELSAALGDDEDFAVNTLALIGTKANQADLDQTNANLAAIDIANYVSQQDFGVHESVVIEALGNLASDLTTLENKSANYDFLLLNNIDCGGYEPSPNPFSNEPDPTIRIDCAIGSGTYDMNI